MMIDAVVIGRAAGYRREWITVPPMALVPRLAAMRSRAATFGIRYALADAAVRAVRRLGQRLEDVLLEVEGARGVLGPAHGHWRGNAAADNRRRWNEWDWSAQGEEWTESAGVIKRTIIQVGELYEIRVTCMGAYPSTDSGIARTLAVEGDDVAARMA